MTLLAPFLGLRQLGLGLRRWAPGLRRWAPGLRRWAGLALAALLPLGLAACGGSGSSGGGGSPPPCLGADAGGGCIAGSGPVVQVTGTVVYQRLVLSVSGLGPLATTKPARFVDVELRIAGGGQCYGNGSTDAAGQYSITAMPPSGSQLEVVVFSRTDYDPLRNATVHDALPPPTNFHTNANCFHHVSPSFAAAAAVVQDLTIPYNAGTSCRPSIGFGTLDVILTCAEAVRVSTGETPPLCHGYTQLGNNGATGTSYYDDQVKALTILGGAAGNLDHSDTDYFDDGVVAHEYHHFVEFNMGHSLNRGGPHGGQDLEPPFAWSEGAATGFGCLLRNSPSYVDSVGTGAPPSAQIVASAENWTPQSVRGIGGEQTVTEIVWDLCDGAGGIPDADGDVAALALGTVYAKYTAFDPASDAPYVGLLLDRLVGNGDVSAPTVALLLAFPENQMITYPLVGADVWPVPLPLSGSVGGTCDWRTNVGILTRTASVWHLIDLPAGGTKTFTLTIGPTNAGGGDQGDDIDLFLETVGGAFLQQSTNIGTTAETIGPVVLGPGKYVVRAQAKPGHHANFTLAVN